jgi:type IV pilus modification protein PilV
MRGFSLLEALISFVIIAVGMLALAKFQADTLENNADAKARTEAVNFAQAQIEQLRNIRDPADFQTALTSGSGTDTATGSHATYTRSWTITQNTDPNYAVVDVIVTWADSTGTTQSVNLSTYIGEVEPAKTGRYFVEMVGVPGEPPTPL